MKKIIFFIFCALGFFVLLSIIILPEYRFRTALFLLIYLAVFYFVFKAYAKEYFINLWENIFFKRTKIILLAVVVFFSTLILGYCLSNLRILRTLKYKMTSHAVGTLNDAQISYVKENFYEPYEVIYIRPTHGQDNAALFNSIMQELSLYAPNIKYSYVHPVAQPERYTEIRKKLPSLIYGNVAVLGLKYSAVSDKVTPYDIINAVYRAKVGLSTICVTQGHDEASIDDFGENGAGIVAQVLRDKGIALYRVDINNINTCPTVLIIDPKKEFTGSEIRLLDSYTGSIVLSGGVGLASINRFLNTKGVSVSAERIQSLSQGALRDYFGGLTVDSVSRHPATLYINSPAVVSYAYAVSCKDCYILAKVASNDVLAIKENLLVFSGASLCSNFFMRFKGNSQLLFGMLNHACCGDIAVIPPDEGAPNSPRLFAISPRYLNLIFVVAVVVVPLLFLILGVYCFRSVKKRY